MNETYDWKAKVAEAEKVMENAVADLKVANEKFKEQVEVADGLAKEAIELGGKDAEQQWNKFKKNLTESLDELMNDIDSAIHKFSEKVNWVKNRYFIIGGVVLIAIVIGLLVK